MNNEIGEKYLPIGTVVFLKEGKKEIMITGYGAQGKEKVLDYVGVVYPEGFINATSVGFFNHEDIDKICQIGYKDEKFPGMQDLLKKSLIDNNVGK